MKQTVLKMAGIAAVTLFLAIACGGGEVPVAAPTVAPIAATQSTPVFGEPGGLVPPHAFVGTATVDGSTAADGTPVTAWLEGVDGPVAETTVSAGRYVIKIVQRGDANYANKKVTFKIGDRDANETFIWEPGGADELNLAAGVGSPPTGGGAATAGTIEIAAAGDSLKFNKAKLTAKAGSEVVVVFNNASTVNQHNWVLVQAGTKDAVAADGATAGPGGSWLQAGDDRVVAHVDLLDPGATGEVRFTAPSAGTYQFVCTFPGHSITMFGEFEVTP